MPLRRKSNGLLRTDGANCEIKSANALVWVQMFFDRSLPSAECGKRRSGTYELRRLENVLATGCDLKTRSLIV